MKGKKSRIFTSLNTLEYFQNVNILKPTLSYLDKLQNMAAGFSK